MDDNNTTDQPTLADQLARADQPAMAEQQALGDRPALAEQQALGDQPAGQSAPERSMPTAWEQMGGMGGMVDSAVPVIVFVIVNVLASLGWAIGAAVAAAAAIAAFRLGRKEPVGQALGGLLGVGVAALIARKTGHAKGFFLLGIWSFVVYGAALLLSIVFRWPLVGLIWENLNGRGNAWRKDKKLVRKYDLATGLWVLMCAGRFVLQHWLYDTDQVGWLALARIVMGYPLFIVVIVGTVLIVNSGSGMTPTQQWAHYRDQRKAAPAKKALTLKERFAIAKEQADRKAGEQPS
ncbi:MAG: DUF3159 domain-containing protein [Actinomycetota bacterium]|nr:DUF3159 domain-containing protein [Actinomycetota bacterium]